MSDLPNFDALLNRLTGEALDSLGQGKTLRQIIHFVMEQTATWKESCQNEMLRRLHFENSKDHEARKVEIEALQAENEALHRAVAFLVPFNRLSPAEVERLAIMAEESSEVIQVVCKILRHGYASTHPASPDGPCNREMLTRELGDVRAAMRLMTEDGDIVPCEVRQAANEKMERITPYLHHHEGEVYPIDLTPFMKPPKEPHAQDR